MMKSLTLASSSETALPNPLFLLIEATLDGRGELYPVECEQRLYDHRATDGTPFTFSCIDF